MIGGVFFEATGVVVDEKGVSRLDVALSVEEHSGPSLKLELHGLYVFKPVRAAMGVVDAAQKLRDVREAIWAYVEARTAV